MRDYKPRPKPAPQPKVKPEPKPAANKPVPGWVWMLAGIAIASLGFSLGKLAEVDAPSRDIVALPAAPQPATSANTNTKPKTSATPSTSQPATQKAEPKPEARFDFYKLLPEKEVNQPKVDTSRMAPTTTESYIYTLQAGAFKRREDAEKRRAEIAFTGYEASIEDADIKAGQSWYRVYVGPFTSRSKMSKARSELLQNNIDTLLLKRKEG